jgi:hypothetical protein
MLLNRIVSFSFFYHPFPLLTIMLSHKVLKLAGWKWIQTSSSFLLLFFPYQQISASSSSPSLHQRLRLHLSQLDPCCPTSHQDFFSIRHRDSREEEDEWILLDSTHAISYDVKWSIFHSCSALRFLLLPLVSKDNRS